MEVSEEKFDLLKINLGLGAAVIGAAKIGVDVNMTSVIIGVSILTYAIIVQYASIMTVYTDETGQPFRMGFWDSIVISSAGGCLFVIIGIAAPYMNEYSLGLVPEFVSTQILPTLFITAMIGLRIYVHSRVEDDIDKAFLAPLMIANCFAIFVVVILNVMGA